MERYYKAILAGLTAVTALYLAVFAWYQSHHAAAVMAQQQEPPVIVLDAGHGGEDGGASASDGTPESGINLEISLRLRDLFRFCGLKVQMIRETDTAVYSAGCTGITEKKVSDLKNRVQTVNAVPEAILISIHQNFFEQSKYKGAQVFYAKTAGSEALAGEVQETLRALDPANRRQCKPSQSVYLMEKVRCTAVLVECGFLSNPEEARLLQTPSYQQKLAAAICSAVLSSIQERGTNDEV